MFSKASYKNPPRKPDLDIAPVQADRAPIATYQQALWRLASLLVKDEQEIPEIGPLPVAAQFLADIFWLNDSKVRADLRRCMRAI